jgi:hypothetical protein
MPLGTLHPCKNNPLLLRPPLTPYQLPLKRKKSSPSFPTTTTSDSLSLNPASNQSTLNASPSNAVNPSFKKLSQVNYKHSKQIQAIQIDMRGLSVVVLEFRTGLLPNAPPILPHSTFSSMRITADLSSLTSVPVPAQANAPPSSRCNPARRDELASPSHIWDSQKESGISSNPRECEMNAPSRFEKI